MERAYALHCFSCSLSPAARPSNHRRSDTMTTYRRLPIYQRRRTIMRDHCMSLQPGLRHVAATRVKRRQRTRPIVSRLPTMSRGSSPGALYQIYASPGQITDIELEPGEQLTGSGPLAAGDTVRWIVVDTESGNGDTRRVHVMVKPTRPAIETNLVVNTDRRTYLIELRSREKAYMPSVAWFYPENRSGHSKPLPPTPFIPEVEQRQYRYVIEGDNPPWRPVNAYDDGRKVYIEFSPGIGQGEMPPLFVIGQDGKPELVNYRVYGNVLIADRLFAAAELRLGADKQQRVRIVRNNGRRS